MSEQNYQHHQDRHENLSQDDPLAELARIVTGENHTTTAQSSEFEQQYSQSAPGSQPQSSLTANLEQPVSHPELEIEATPPVEAQQESLTENAHDSRLRARLAEENMSLESQLMAELNGGGQQDVQSPEPALQAVSQAQQPGFEHSPDIAAQNKSNAWREIEQIHADDMAIAAVEDPQVMSSGDEVEEVVHSSGEQQIVVDQPDLTHENSAQLQNGVEYPSANEVHSQQGEEAQVVTRAPVEKFDFDAVFTRELAKAGAQLQAAEPVSPPQHLDKALSVRETTEVEANAQVDELTQETYVEQPQSYPVYQDLEISGPEQQIENSVHELQYDLVESMDIETAFSDAFASEISLEMDAEQLPPGQQYGVTIGTMPDDSQQIAGAQTDFIDDGRLPRTANVMMDQKLALDASFGLDQQGQSDPLANQNAQMKARPAQKKSGFRMAAAALGIAILAGSAVVGYGYFGEANNNSEPVLVRADQSNFKVKPEKPGGKEISNQDQPVYDAMAGEKTIDASQKKLIATDETPVELAPNVSASVNGVVNDASTRLAKIAERLTTSSNLPAKKSVVEFIQPRKVKTVTVRADGTIVTSQGEEVASLAALPNTTLSAQNETVQKAASNSIDGASTTGKIPIPSLNPIHSIDNSRTNSLKATKIVSQNNDAQKAASALANKKIAQISPIPLPVTTTKVVTEPVAFAAEEAPVLTTAPLPKGSYVVQISSQRSLEAAEASYQNLKRRFSSLLSNQPTEIREGKVEGKGTFYRVRIPLGELAQASQFCQKYKSAGGSCFVTR